MVAGSTSDNSRPTSPLETKNSKSQATRRLTSQKEETKLKVSDLTSSDHGWRRRKLKRYSEPRYFLDSTVIHRVLLESSSFASVSSSNGMLFRVSLGAETSFSASKSKTFHNICLRRFFALGLSTHGWLVPELVTFLSIRRGDPTSPRARKESFPSLHASL